MNDLISIIVPVYNVEKYLDRCVESIVNQTYTNIEIILVDDGSPDNCPTICDEWAKKDNRIRVIHKANGGLSDARNAGLAVASGEYIAFVDSDDWIDTQMYKVLYESIINTKSDIASCGARRVWLDGRPACELIKDTNDCVLEREDAMKALISSNGLIQVVWNKLYKRNVVEGIQYPVGLIHEDEFWSWRVISRANRIVILKESFYNYLQRDDSIMGIGFSKMSLLVVQAKIERQLFIEEVMPNLTDLGRLDLTYTCMHIAIRILKTINYKEAISYMQELKCTIRKYPISKEYLNMLSIKQRIHVQLLRMFWYPVCWLHSIR